MKKNASTEEKASNIDRCRRIGNISAFIGLIVLVFTYPPLQRILRALGFDPQQIFYRSPIVYETLDIVFYVVFIAVFYFIGYIISLYFIKNKKHNGV